MLQELFMTCQKQAHNLQVCSNPEGPSPTVLLLIGRRILAILPVGLDVQHVLQHICNRAAGRILALLAQSSSSLLSCCSIELLLYDPDICREQNIFHLQAVLIVHRWLLKCKVIFRISFLLITVLTRPLLARDVKLYFWGICASCGELICSLLPFFFPFSQGKGQDLNFTLTIGGGEDVISLYCSYTEKCGLFKQQTNYLKPWLANCS